MVQHDPQPTAQRKTKPPAPLGRKAVAAARDRYQGSLAQGFVTQLSALGFIDQIMLFGAGLLVSLLPFLILLSAFASNRVDDDIALRLGLNRQASGIMTHLLTSAPATLSVATVTSLLFVAAGALAGAGALQQIYEKTFGPNPPGWRGGYRPLVLVRASGLVLAPDTPGRPVRDAPAGAALVELVPFAIWAPFFWWSMHFLLAGRVPWRRLLPSAIFTGAFYVGLGIFSKFYFSSTITSDSHTYGTIGAIL